MYDPPSVWTPSAASLASSASGAGVAASPIRSSQPSQPKPRPDARLIATNATTATTVATAVRQPSSHSRLAVGRDASWAATGSPATARTVRPPCGFSAIATPTSAGAIRNVDHHARQRRHTQMAARLTATIGASLWPAPMKCSTSSGLSTASHSAVRLWMPSRPAIRGTSHSIAAAASNAGSRIATIEKYGWKPASVTIACATNSASGPQRVDLDRERPAGCGHAHHVGVGAGVQRPAEVGVQHRVRAQDGGHEQQRQAPQPERHPRVHRRPLPGGTHVPPGPGQRHHAGDDQDPVQRHRRCPADRVDPGRRPAVQVEGELGMTRAPPDRQRPREPGPDAQRAKGRRRAGDHWSPRWDG